MNEIPLVSISCVTFNHAPYLRECLEGFLMQQCDFKFEILIHDDASTDGTRAIIEEYTQKYPGIFFPMYQTENQYSQGVRGMMTKFNFPRCKGKYIALCEGDDYWTDSLKLQKQVDFLEKNLDYSLVCGGFKTVNTHSDKEEFIIKYLDKLNNNEKGFDITIERFFQKWLTKTLTVVFRKDFHEHTDLKGYKYSKDVHLYYHLLKKGKGYYFKEIFGAYRIHDGGVFSLISRESKLKSAYFVFKELSKYNLNDVKAKKAYFESLRNIIKNKIYLREEKLKKYKLIIELFSLVSNKEELKKAVKSVVSLK